MEFSGPDVDQTLNLSCPRPTNPGPKLKIDSDTPRSIPVLNSFQSRNRIIGNKDTLILRILLF